jgi:hypothetical protein
MKKYISAVLSIGTIGMLFYTLFDLRQQVNSLKKELVITTAQKDSLYDVNFGTQVENGRYELTINYLESVNPKAANQFKTYMGHETE